MLNIFKSKKTFLYTVICSIIIALTSCSSYNKESDIGKRKAQKGTIVDKVFYYPRKFSLKFNDWWDKNVAGVPPDWQKYMDLGEARKPVYNPGGALYDQGMLEAEEGEPLHPYDPRYKDPMRYGDENRPQMKSNRSDAMQMKSPQTLSAPNTNDSGYGYVAPQNDTAKPKYDNAIPAYVPPPSMAPVDSPQYTPLMPSPVGMNGQSDSAIPMMETQEQDQALPWQQNDAGQSPVASGGQENYNEGDVKVSPDGTVPAPVAPWEKSNDYMGTDSSSQDYQPVYQDGAEQSSYSSSPYAEGNQEEDLSNIGGSVDPYEPGGFEDGFNPPSYEDLEKMGGDPFAPVQNKYKKVFEPMASEHRIDSNGIVETKAKNQSFIPLPVVRKKVSKQSNRPISKTMFPLQQYAPQSNADIEKNSDTYNKSGVISFSDRNVADAAVDNMILNLGEEGTASAIEIQSHSEVNDSAKNNLANNNIDKSEEQPVAISPVKQSDLMEINPEKTAGINPKSDEYVFVPNNMNQSKKTSSAQDGSEVGKKDKRIKNIDSEFDKIKLSLLPVDKQKVQAAPISNAEIVFPKAKNFNNKKAPIDLHQVNKVSAVKVEKPLLDVPEIKNINKQQQPQFAEVEFEDLPSDLNAESELVQQTQQKDQAKAEEPPQIVVVTPATNEYVAPPVVNIRKQFEKYRQENNNTGYSLLPNSRYSGRRGSSN